MNTDTKPKLFPLLMKKKNDDDKFKNGIKRKINDTMGIPIKKKCSEVKVLPLARKPPSTLQNPLAPKKIKMHVTNIKDPKFVNKMMEKRVGADDIFDQIKTYICKFCCRRFTNPNTLKVHLLTHKDNPTHKCHVCGFIVSTFSSLMAHYVKHSGIKTFGVSDFIKNEVPSSGATDAKIRVEKNKNNIVCTKCNRTFSSHALLSSHYCLSVNKKTEYVCTYCRTVTSTVEEYRDHIQSHSTAHLVCCYCMVKFETKSNLQTHLKVCKKKKANPASSSAAAKKLQFPKYSSLSGLKFRKIKPKVESVSSDSQSKDNQESKPDVITNNSSDETQKSCPSPAADPVKSEVTKNVVRNGNRPMRSQRLKSSIAQEQSLSESLPARRSARLVNRKPVKFSLSSDSEIDENNNQEESRSPQRQRSPAKSAENLVPLEVSPSPKKTKSQQKEHLLPNCSPKSPKKAKEPSQGCEKLIQPKLEIKTEPDLIGSCNSQDSKATSSETSVDVIIDSVSKLPEEPKNINISFSSPKNLKMKLSSVKPKPKGIGKKKQSVTPTKKNNADIKPTITLICNLCSLIFRSKGSLKRHRKMHSGKPQFSCQYCGKFFFRKDIHRRHEDNVHLSPQDRQLVCYYCKEAFTDSSKLVEHSYAVHAARAMAPERIRRCTYNTVTVPDKVVTESNVETAMTDSSGTEHENSDKVETADDVYDKKDRIYNCGMCNITFNSPPDLVEHFNKLHCVSGNLNIVQLEKDSKSPQVKNVKKTPTKKEKSDSTLRANVLKKASPTKKPTANNSTESKPNSSPKKNAEQNSPPEEETAVPVEPECLNIEQRVNDKCSHYCAVSSTTEPSSCDENAGHKAVEWYQCQICPISGPISKMKEHMFKHMTKIGIFIVSCENKDFDNLLTQTPFLKEDCDVTDPLTENDQINEYTSEQSCIDEDIIDSTLEPSNVSSVCSLMTDIKCKRCDEVIIDFDVIRNHPCLLTDDSYSCFVENCEFISSSEDEILDHLREAHYEPLYSDTREQSGISSTTDIIDDTYEYDSVQMRVSESECILIEPCIDIIKCL